MVGIITVIVCIAVAIAAVGLGWYVEHGPKDEVTDTEMDTDTEQYGKADVKEN
ncbi:MAG: hypothetical protein ACI4E1_10845 [Lachnospira sp.]